MLYKSVFGVFYAKKTIGKGNKMIIVYSKPACVQCTATTKELDRKGISYDYVDITQDSDAMSRVVELGYKQAPVVVNGDDHWAGFRPDKISQIAA
jgi:glutaredoxin-like protein NrdH